MKIKEGKKVLSLLLAVVMTFSLTPIRANAAVESDRKGLQFPTRNNENAVAQIGTTKYESIASAVNDAKAGDVVELITDTKEDVTIPSGTEITLELKGNTIRGTVTNEGTLTVKDSTSTVKDEYSGSGMIQGQKDHGLINAKSGFLTIESGVFDTLKHAKGAIYNQGTIKDISGGIFQRSDEESTSTGEATNSWYVIKNEKSAVIEKISGGYFYNTSYYSSLFDNYGTIDEISGGYFTNGFHVIKVEEDSSIGVISGGTFESTGNEGSSLLNFGHVEITEGTFIANNAIAIFQSLWENYRSSLTVDGGTFKGERVILLDANEYSSSLENAVTVQVNGGDFSGSIVVQLDKDFEKKIEDNKFEKSIFNINLSGGTYSEAPNESFIAEGNSVILKNNKYVVSLPNPVDAKAPSIEKLSENISVEPKQEAILSVTATAEAEGVLSYQWYSCDSKGENSRLIDKANSESYSPDTSNKGTYYYYIKVTNTNEKATGNKTTSATSQVVTLTVIDNIAPILSDGTYKRTSHTAAKIGFTTDEDGTAFYLIKEKGATAPTSNEVAAGTSLDKVSGTTSDHAITLTKGAKDIYVVVKDVAGNISEPLKIEVKAYSSGSPSGGSSSSSTVTYAVSFNSNGGSSVTSQNVMSGSKATEPKAPTKDGYTFTGWYSDSSLSNKFNFNTTITKATTLYAGWEKATDIEKDVDNDSEQQTTAHSAYISGYADGTFRPDAGITRAEATQLLYNQLNSKSGYSKAFTDVEADAWYYDAVSLLAGKGAISGYTDGTFLPNNSITRAEFVTLVVRYAGLSTQGTEDFADVNGHWANTYIGAAVNAGYVGGYSDGTFQPDTAITRAEAVTILNRMLGRTIVESELNTLTMPFSDVSTSHWAYYNILEAAGTA